MWMMGYNEGGDSTFVSPGRKLRPLIPRPSSSSLNHHLGASSTMGEQNKREAVVSSSRWNPTPEQLRVLEDLYHRGTRTPSADQIQHITAQLRRFGKIEGKNVFYWFQNHKARERQKRRRHLEFQHLLSNHNFDPKDPGPNRTAYEAEQDSKNWISSTTCAALIEESVSRGRATKAVMGRNATRKQMMPLPYGLLWNSTPTIPSSSAYYSQSFLSKLIAMDAKPTLFEKEHRDGGSHDQTLQLFPLRKEEES